MSKKKTIAITEDNIPIIIEAIKNYGELPTIRSENTFAVLKVFLYLSLESKNNIVHIKMAHLSKMIGISTSLVANKLKLLINYNFVENITPKGEVASIWKINLQKVQLAMNIAFTAQKIQSQLPKKQI